METIPVSIVEANLADAAQAEAVVDIIDSYARGPGGQNAALSETARKQMANGIREHPAYFVLLAYAGGEAVGAAVCFRGFSTFAGQPFLNLHDFAVLPAHRGRGVGGQLLDAIEERARNQGCCKITLEVHDTNAGAKALYERRGFGPWEAPTWSVTRPL